MAKKKQKKKSKNSIKRVAIVGKGPGRGLAPKVKTPGIDIWGCNNIALQQHVDTVFDMHDLDWTLEENRANYSHLDLSEEELELRVQLRDAGFKGLRKACIEKNMRIVSVKEYADIPRSVRFPLESIREAFGCDLFTSVIPYMIAYAIWCKYNWIDIYGVNCLHAEEWAYQREAVSAWIMFAKGRGIKVTVNGQDGRPLRLKEGDLLYGFNVPQAPVGVEVEDGWIEAVDHIKAARYGFDPERDEHIERKFKVIKEV